MEQSFTHHLSLSNVEAQSLYPHNATSHTPLPRPPCDTRIPKIAFPRHLRYPSQFALQSRALRSSRHDAVGQRPLRHLAALLPPPHHSPTPREDRRRSAHKFHMAFQILLQSLDRAPRSLTSAQVARTSLHARAIYLRSCDHGPLPDLVLVTLGQCWILDDGVYLEHL